MLAIYKLVIARLGIASLGVWALVLGATSIARFGNTGLATGLTRFVALGRSNDEHSITARTYVETALLGTAGFQLVLAVVVYWPAWYLLALALNGDQLETARHLLPFAIAAFASLNISGIVASALIGYHRSDVKSILRVIALFVQFAIAWLSVKEYGLVGLAWAQIAQRWLIIVGGWLFILRVERMSIKAFVPYRIDPVAFREMFGFGIRLQVLNIVASSYEPLTKFAFSAIAGPAALGLYEVIYRTIIQMRAFVAVPSENLTPIFASIDASDVRTRQRTCDLATAGVSLLGAGGTSAIILASPILSVLFLGHLDRSFVVYAALLSVGWFFNIASIPAYLLGVADGYLNWNIIGAAVSTGLSPVLILGFGTYSGPVGMVLASSVAIAAGGVVTIIKNRDRAKFSSAYPAWSIYYELITRVKRRLFNMRIGAPSDV